MLAGADGAIGLGCSADDYAGVPTGDIVVTLRGECPRVDRATLGQAAGAAAVIMVNDADKDVFPPLEGAIKDVTIPFLGVKPSAAAALQAAGGTTVTISGGTTLVEPGLPVRRRLLVRRAGGRRQPQARRRGARPVGPVGRGRHRHGRRPGIGNVHVDAARRGHRRRWCVQAHPTWTPEQVKAAIMNTASATAVAGYDPRVAGAGLVQPAAAVSTVAIATTGPGTASLSFGAPALDAAYASSKTIRIQNTGRASITYRLKATFAGSSLGVHVTLDALDRDRGGRPDRLGVGHGSA